MKLLIDADACPREVLRTSLELGRRFQVPVWTVASFNHVIASDRHVVVGGAAQETDIKVMNLAEPGDVAVTQDFGLAAMLIGKGVRCLGPSGRLYDAERIDLLLEERELKARFRRGGGRTKGPKKRTAEEDRRFAGALETLLREWNG
ncbi:conserved hypothetical protein [Heliomicrobium modesticaldum Ice1]|uniref:UPF0178 protein Helmi_09130 n=1 Tax=Heliobacterium modesticaldum (strain ATCC 51547 / Ice1) TaxID=498761 RepID=Y913_HELMI|nr:DUF188 domain-containing protein [Heliomicrobium modesticaldum]B0TIB8.1 RecName: Full=UPF0178 protein Helmi_09130 [Heliomicrobium modesticaldum Ice1]ABZ83538.1 conserved hypothetical protein [Heliomicrobium modesticaldum Ice1]